MKILPVTKEVPIEKTRRGYYSELWAKVHKLKRGEWLPVQCKDDIETRLIASAAVNTKNHFVARKRGMMVYLAKRTV